MQGNMKKTPIGTRVVPCVSCGRDAYEKYNPCVECRLKAAAAELTDKED